MPRITQQAKQATRQRIVDEACRLFRDKGFDASTTRDMAEAAAIATGTLFNYFPTKEAIVMELVVGGLNRARNDFLRVQRDEATLEEDLFLHVATCLRHLKSYRTYIRPVLETVLCPIATSSDERTASLRTEHLEMVQQIVHAHVSGIRLTPVALQLYWTLYTGLLAYWTDDTSPKQEDSRSMLDQSISMFVSWLQNDNS